MKYIHFLFVIFSLVVFTSSSLASSATPESECKCSSTTDHATLSVLLGTTTPDIGNYEKCINLLREDLPTVTDKKVKEKCSKRLAHIESELRDIGRQFQNDVDKSEEQNDPDLKNSPVIQQKKKDLAVIHKTISFTGNSLFKNFDDYDQYLARFNAGYEFASVNELFEKGFPRLGFMIYGRIVETLYPDYTSGFGLYGFHQGLNVRLSSNVSTTVNKDAVASQNNQTLSPEKSLEFDIPNFLPIYRIQTINRGKLWGYFGPIIDIGGSKFDKDKVFHWRRYIGFRTAFSPEFYSDIMIGKGDGYSPQAWRVELRGQLPVYETDKGLIFVGAVVNGGLRKEKTHDRDQEDLFKIFITWDIDFMSLFSGGAPTQ